MGSQGGSWVSARTITIITSCLGKKSRTALDIIHQTARFLISIPPSRSWHPLYPAPLPVPLLLSSAPISAPHEPPLPSDQPSQPPPPHHPRTHGEATPQPAASSPDFDSAPQRPTSPQRPRKARSTSTNGSAIAGASCFRIQRIGRLYARRNWVRLRGWEESLRRGASR